MAWATCYSSPLCGASLAGVDAACDAGMVAELAASGAAVAVVQLQWASRHSYGGWDRNTESWAAVLDAAGPSCDAWRPQHAAWMAGSAVVLAKLTLLGLLQPHWLRDQAVGIAEAAVAANEVEAPRRAQRQQGRGDAGAAITVTAGVSSLPGDGADAWPMDHPLVCRLVGNVEDQIQGLRRARRQAGGGAGDSGRGDGPYASHNAVNDAGDELARGVCDLRQASDGAVGAAGGGAGCPLASSRWAMAVLRLEGAQRARRDGDAHGSAAAGTDPTGASGSSSGSGDSGSGAPGSSGDVGSAGPHDAAAAAAAAMVQPGLMALLRSTKGPADAPPQATLAKPARPASWPARAARYTALHPHTCGPGCGAVVCARAVPTAGGAEPGAAFEAVAQPATWLCGGCGAVRYCSASCQRRDYRWHTPVCRQLRAGRAAEGGGDGSVPKAGSWPA